MTPEAQRIAIAEVCGWTECQRCTRNLKPTPDGVEIRGRDPKGDHTNGWKEYGLLPDYLSDLDAMHKAENLCINTVQLEEDYYFAIKRNFRATAAQRAEALLRALGKWVDD